MSLNNRGSFLVIAAVSLIAVLGQQGHCQNYRGHGGFSYSQSVIRNNLDTRRAQLNAEVRANLAAGKLHPSEAALLRDKLIRLADLQLTYSEDSALNDRETNHLVNGYAQVTTDMNRMISSRASLAPTYRWNAKGNRFYKHSTARVLAERVDRAVVNGLITPREADRMRSRYLVEGPRFNARLNELDDLLDSMQRTRSANTRIRNWQ